MINNSLISGIWPSTNTYDVLMYADDNNYSLSDTVGSHTAGYPANTSPPGQGLPIGVYTIDESTWYPLDLTSNYVLLSQAGGSLQLRYRGSGGTTITPHFKLGVISISETEILSGPIGGGAVNSYTSQGKYQPIAVQGEQAMVAGTVTVAHNLGYVPTVKLWNRSADNIIAPIFTGGTGVVGQGIRLDSTNLYLDGILPTNFSFTPQNWIYRIYADA